MYALREYNEVICVVSRFFTEEGIASAFLGRGFVWYVLVRGSDT